MFGLDTQPWNLKQKTSVWSKSQEQEKVSKILEREEIISLHLYGLISEMTSLLHSLSGWTNWLITGALIGSLLSWKVSAILNHYNLPTFSLFPNHRVTPRPCLWTQAINALTLCASGSQGHRCLCQLSANLHNSPSSLRVSQVGLSDRLLGSLQQRTSCWCLCHLCL